MRKSRPHLKLRQVEVFLEAARQGNFGAAASELGITPAALSQAVADLERSLGAGVVLFERDQRGARLTPAGEAFVKHGERLLAAADAGRLAVKTLPTVDGLFLRVAYAPGLTNLVAAAASRVLRKHTGLTIESFQTFTGTAGSEITHENADIGVDYIYGETACHTEVVAESRLWCLTSARHELASRSTIPLSSLESEPFALPWRQKMEGTPIRVSVRDGSWEYDSVNAYFQEHAFAPKRITYRANRFASIFAFVRTGAAVTIAPTPEVCERPGLALLPLDPPSTAQPVALLWRKGYLLSDAATEFVEDVKKRLLDNFRDESNK